ncbi:hypothetical protein HNO88_003734 [Novosphingobium chloroacetimidivorans]|uniref:Recombinase family protein n=1 Tax=Novosphingobium chloroacetimidivorans TaxID=1428314 RepID=A0A7W7NXH8_9SPHN|nr:recombinase family protein [Novosphingobium chloroacetimidivorans]MBB4860391.1 hypothetical protein [Novosphingobium chloroacetimidivorans]
MTLAYIYARYSDDKQSFDSIERQVKLGTDFAREHGWEVDDSRILIDEAKSAFKGHNRKDGSALAAFEAAAREGKRVGSVLVFENIDRLSRQGPIAALKLVWSLQEQGVTVASTHDREVYEPTAKSAAFDLVRIALTAERAHEESATKSKRSNAYWERVREGIRSGLKKAVAGNVPAWIDVADDLTMSLNDQRCQVLNEIFDLYGDGIGVNRIAKLLNERGEPTWGVEYRTGGKGWAETYLHKLLKNRAAVGEKWSARNNGGELLASDFYPQAVIAAKFDRAQAVRARKSKAGTGGATTYAGGNLFRSIATCGECGSRMHYIRKGPTAGYTAKDGTVRHYERKLASYLQCDRARRAAGCQNKTQYPYDTLEAAVLHWTFSFAHDDTNFAVNNRMVALENELAEASRKLTHLETAMANYIETLELAPSRTIGQKIASLEVEIDAVTADRERLTKELEQERAEGSRMSQLQAIEALWRTVTGADDEARQLARIKTNAALARLVSSFRFYESQEATLVTDEFALTFDRGGNLIDSALLGHIEDDDSPEREEMDRASTALILDRIKARQTVE